MLPGAYNATQIKTIGDALTLRVAEPAAAVRLGCVLARGLMAEHGYPTMNVGMRSAPALEREVDSFGATVNLGARISGLAGGGEELASEVTRAAAVGAWELLLRPRRSATAQRCDAGPCLCRRPQGSAPALA